MPSHIQLFAISSICCFSAVKIVLKLKIELVNSMFMKVYNAEINFCVFCKYYSIIILGVWRDHHERFESGGVVECACTDEREEVIHCCTATPGDTLDRAVAAAVSPATSEYSASGNCAGTDQILCVCVCACNK